MKKICYVFVFNGFADHEIALAASTIRRNNNYQVKTIAINKEPVQAMSGMTILPDFDFLPDTDLIDIDADNTAMLILPALHDDIMPLINHCLLFGIPIVSSHGHVEDLINQVSEILNSSQLSAV